jgi:hypothetical protein
MMAARTQTVVSTAPSAARRCPGSAVSRITTGHGQTGSPRRTANRRCSTPPSRYGGHRQYVRRVNDAPSRRHPYASGAVEGHRGRHDIGRVKKENSASPWTRCRRSPLGVPDSTSRPLRSAPRDAPDGGPFGRDLRDGRREQRRRIRVRPLTRAFSPWTLRTRAHLPK